MKIGGATCCSVLFHGTILNCCGMGNCRAVVIDKIGKANYLSNYLNAKIDDEDSVGGFEKCFRIGELDSYLNQVSDSTDCKTFNVAISDIAVVIATDGVWRFLTPEKVGSIVMMHK